MQLTNIPIISMIKDMAKWIVLRDEFLKKKITLKTCMHTHSSTQDTYLLNRSSASLTSTVFLFAWIAYVSKSSASRWKNLSILSDKQNKKSIQCR